MDNSTFRETIYGPYMDTWKIIRLIQYADQTADSDAQWQRYIKEIDRLAAAYPDNPFTDKLITLLLDAGDVIAKMNGGGTNAIQKAEKK